MSTSPDSDTSKMRLSKPESAPILAQASSKVPAPLRTKLTLALSLVAGYVDAYAFLKYSVYASFMSGNTTQTGLQAGQAQFTTAARDFLPIPLFVIGVFAGIILNDRRLRWRCGLVAGLLIISAAYPHLDTHNGWFIIVILSFAMGIMNTTVTHIGGQSVHLGFVTGPYTALRSTLHWKPKVAAVPHSLAPWDSHHWRASLLAAIWIAFLVGALSASIGTPYFNTWTPLFPAGILLAAVPLNDADD